MVSDENQSNIQETVGIHGILSISSCRRSSNVAVTTKIIGLIAAN